MAITNKTPRLRSAIGLGIGIGSHMTMARVSASMGAVKNKRGEEEDGRMGSLINSFTPSAIGCSSPYGPTTLGPFRSCMYPNTLRSTRVKKATARRTGAI